MNTFKGTEVQPNLYRSLYTLNKKTIISVRTGAGLTDKADAGELIGQGSAGGALASQVNIDMSLNGYFSAGSKDEASYEDIRLQPLSF